MSAKNDKAELWTILITVVLLVAVFSIFIYTSSQKENTGDSGVFLSVGSSDGFTNSQVNPKSTTLSIAPDCTPESGFNKCFQYEKTYSFSGANARAYVKIQGSDSFIGKQKGGYYVGQVAVPLKFEGDKFYMYENFGTWDNLWNNIARCDKDGCKGSTRNLASNDNYVLANPGQEYQGCPAFVAFDFDCDGDCFNDDSEDPWAWATISGGWGWAGTSGSCLNIKSVACYDDSDCGSSNQYCDKSGTWQEWSCKQKECTVDADCSALAGTSEPYCSGKDLNVTVSTATCSTNYKCVKTETPTVQNTCFLGCSEDKNQCTEKTPTFIIGAILGVLILLIIIVIVVLKVRRK